MSIIISPRHCRTLTILPVLPTFSIQQTIGGSASVSFGHPYGRGVSAQDAFMYEIRLLCIDSSQVCTYAASYSRVPQEDRNIENVALLGPTEVSSDADSWFAHRTVNRDDELSPFLIVEGDNQCAIYL